MEAHGCYHYCYQQGQSYQKTAQQILVACFRDANGRQRRKSTKTSDRKKAIKIAEQYEQVGQRKMPARAVRETLAELYREMYNASVPTATVRGFVDNWLKTKQPEVPMAKPLRQHIDSLPAGFQPGTPIHPKAFKIINRHGRSANLSNHFADLLAQAGLRERAPHHLSKGKGRSSQRASNNLSFHSLRHTAVSLLKDAGIPEGVVMELVGHDSKSMSAHYTHVGVEALKKAVAALPEI